jgi:tRNA A-37 threonylcarbamoyl transferase component Bud32
LTPCSPSSCEFDRGLDVDAFLARHERHAAELREFLAADAMLPSLADSGFRTDTGVRSSSGSGGPFAAGDVSSRRRSLLDPEVAPLPSVPGYEVIRELGRGGMSVVYEARRIGLNRSVAIKAMRRDAHRSAEDARRLLREAKAIAGLRHPHVIPIIDVVETEERLHLVMPLLPGRDLQERLGDGPLAAREAARLIAAVARGVAEAHRAGIIHRDLKPSNILLDERNEPMVADFGLARDDTGDSSLLTAEDQIVGTPSYMAPEQAQGGARVGAAADLWSLGATLYALVTGRPPFQSDSPLETLLMVRDAEPVRPRRLNPRVPVELEAIILRCLSREPAERYASADDLADDLGRYLAGEPVEAGRSWRLQVRGYFRGRHDDVLSDWSPYLLQLAGIVGGVHLAAVAIEQLGPNVLGGAAAFAPLVLRLILGLVIVLQLRRWRGGGIAPVTPFERAFWGIGFGYFAATIAAELSLRWPFAAGPVASSADVIRAESLLAGPAFFATGGLIWPACHVIGALFLLLALTSPSLGGFAGPAFALLWVFALVMVAAIARRSAR